MKEEGKKFTDTTAKNCGFNCFMGRNTKKIKDSSQSESFWPKFRRRTNHDEKKTMTEYAVKISSPGNETAKSKSFVLSFSRGGKVIPVKIVEQKNTQKISVKKKQAGKRSWVRIAIGAFGFSSKKSPNGKVIQDPPPAEALSEIVAVQPASPAEESLEITADQHSETLNSDLRDSTPRSVEKSSVARKIRAIDRVQGHATAPSSPMKVASPSTSYSKMCTPPRLIKVHRLVSTVLDSEQNPPSQSRFKDRDSSIVFSAMIIILFCLLISDKIFAIVCTSIWWYAVPKLRSISKSEEPLKNPKVKKLLIKSLSNSNIDLHSSEYRKKVIMDGILQRNHKIP